MWLKKLKIAVIQKDTDSLNMLLDSIPELKDEAEIEEVLYLLTEATSTYEKLRDDTSSSMKQIKQNLKFLKSTQEDKTSILDIKS